MKKYVAAVLLFAAPAVFAQELKLAVFDRLKDKATEVTDINLPKALIDLGGGVLGQAGITGGDAAKVKSTLAGITGILVKSLEFDKEGVYTNADVKSLIAELAGPGWNQVVKSIENKGKDVSYVWMKPVTDQEVGGLRVLNAEGRELTVVQILGKIRLEDLPNLDILNQHGKPEKKKDEE